MELTKDELCELLEYNEDTGDLIWLPRPLSMFKSERSMKSWNTRYAGKFAGTVHKFDCKMYIQLSIMKKLYLAHRVIAEIAGLTINAGDCVDHKNGDGTDNRLCNLRVTNQLGNMRNVKKSAKNTSGTCGVTWSKRDNKWQSQISVNNKCVYLGRFSDINKAIEARRTAESKYNFHPNHGTDRPL